MSYKAKKILKRVITSLGVIGVLGLTLIVFGVSYTLNKEKVIFNEAKAGCAARNDRDVCTVFTTDNSALRLKGINIADRVYAATEQGNIAGFDVDDSGQIDPSDFINLDVDSPTTGVDSLKTKYKSLGLEESAYYDADGSLMGLPYNDGVLDFKYLQETGKIRYIPESSLYDPGIASPSSNPTVNPIASLARLIRDYIAIYSTLGVQMPSDWLSQLVNLLK